MVLCSKHLTGDTVFDLYEKQIREGKPHNKEFADATLPYIKVTEFIFLVSIPVLLLLNILSDKVYRLYPFVVAIRLAGFFLVAIDYGAEVHQYYFLIILIHFGFTAYDFWRSSLAFLAPVIATIVSSEVHYDDYQGNIAKHIFMCLVYLISFLGLVTLTFGWGNMIVKNFVIRKGYGKLLDTLKDGVIVADSSDGKLMFANKAAKSFNKNLKESLCIELDETTLVQTKDDKVNKYEDPSAFCIFDCKVK